MAFASQRTVVVRRLICNLFLRIEGLELALGRVLFDRELAVFSRDCRHFLLSDHHVSLFVVRFRAFVAGHSLAYFHVYLHLDHVEILRLLQVVRLSSAANFAHEGLECWGRLLGPAASRELAGVGGTVLEVDRPRVLGAAVAAVDSVVQSAVCEVLEGEPGSEVARVVQVLADLRRNSGRGGLL